MNIYSVSHIQGLLALALSFVLAKPFDFENVIGLSRNLQAYLGRSGHCTLVRLSLYPQVAVGSQPLDRFSVLHHIARALGSAPAAFELWHLLCPLGPVNLSALLRGMVETYPNLQSPQADGSVELENIVVIHGNQAALTQIFSNLLGNAVKFWPWESTPAFASRRPPVRRSSRRIIPRRMPHPFLTFCLGRASCSPRVASRATARPFP